MSLASSKYLEYLFSPLDLIRTKKVLQVNPTAPPKRNEPDNVRITLYSYDEQKCHSRSFSDAKGLIDNLHPGIKWINIDGIRKDIVEEISHRFEIHQLITEDILSSGQRPKMDELNDRLFCVLNMLYFNPGESSVETEQISIVLGEDFVLSFQEDASRDVFNSLREKLNLPNSKVRQNKADFLFYMLIDAIVDRYFVVMEQLGSRIEDLEEDIVRNPNQRTLARINQFRKEMIVLKRNLSPVREMISGILRSESSLIEERTVKYIKDIYDHIVQANDLADNYRDMMINFHDLYMSNVNLKLNEVMKVMAIVTCLLAPATVIGGIFGMNFDRIPLLHNQWGFFISVALMLFIPLWMIYFFKKRGWF
jgi:magnesium transporter